MDTGAELPTGEAGELLFRRPNLFSGYFRDEENTSLAIDQDGWFHTGDICRLDEDPGKVAAFHVPRYVRFVTEWPMSGTKIRKVDLREAIAKELKERGITMALRDRFSLSLACRLWMGGVPMAVVKWRGEVDRASCRGSWRRGRRSGVGPGR